MGSGMRIAILGGTRFIGVAVVEELIAHGHAPLVIHRGGTEAVDAPDVPHAHLDRHDVAGLRKAMLDHRAEVLVDTCAFDTADAEDALAAAPRDVPIVVYSSQDVYRAFATLRAEAAPTDAVPLDEDAVLRSGDTLYPYRGTPPYPGSGVENTDTYEKLDVERIYLTRGACVLRLPMVYGERDPKRREEFVLRRVRAGRTRIPIGAGSLLWSRVGVREVARATRLAAELGVHANGVFNVAERTCWSVEAWMRQILACAGHEAELVPVSDTAVPEDLWVTKNHRQHVNVDSGRARRVLGWEVVDPMESVKRSVAWHLAHRPDRTDPDFSADDAALG